MKKFLKVIGVVILVVVLAGGIFIYSIRDRISLYTSILKKYSEFVENGQNLTEDLSLKSIDSIDYDDIIYKNTNGTPLTLDIYGPKRVLRVVHQ